jgi:hypothetical protein
MKSKGNVFKIGVTKLAQSAYIKLVPASTQQTVTLNEVKDLFHYYKEITSKTGEQVSWEYDGAALPYEIEETEEGKDNWFILRANTDRYKYIIVGVGKEETEENSDEEARNYIQVVLPEGATYGDKGKANEFSKFLAKKLSGQLHLFNKRIMYYYKRK